MEPTENGKKRPQGFASMSPERHSEVSAKGGAAKVPKGLAKLSSEERSRRASEAATARWAKRKEANDDSDVSRQENRDTEG